jgi:hypothetical protein
MFGLLEMPRKPVLSHKILPSPGCSQASEGKIKGRSFMDEKYGILVSINKVNIVIV